MILFHRNPTGNINVVDYPQVGGGRRLEVDARPGQLSATRRVILIHGFNSPLQGSAVSFDKFQRQLKTVAPRLCTDVKLLTWPGVQLYPDAIDLAKGEVADKLAEYLTREVTSNLKQLIFVAHSLGCRLILEILNRLPSPMRDDVLPRVYLFLMAAAVPVRMLSIGAGQRAAGQLTRTVTGCAKAEIFYSRTDLVLGTLFPLFQRRDQGGRITSAVGWSGEPATLWGRRRHHMYGFEHGSYWDSDTVAYLIALSLRAVESMPLRRQRQKARLREARELSARRLALRELPRRSL